MPTVSSLHRVTLPYTNSMRLVRISLGPRSYSIHVGEGLLPRVGAECVKLGFGRACAVISDTCVARGYAAETMASLERAGFAPHLITVPAGERSKTLRQTQACCERLAAHRLDRGSFVVALGGGVVGDLAGFVAGVYLRGIRSVQIPTTLLAQVDSSVGGKTGVNLRAGKNLVGVFRQPDLVLCDTSVLATLPQRELRAGLAEVIKYSVILDAALFRWLEINLDRLLELDQRALTEVISRCCRLKGRVVAADERESGLRAILNFGHTVGHAIESVWHYGKYVHGEAVAIGMVVAARLSTRLVNLPEADFERLLRLLERAGLPTSTPLTSARKRRLGAVMRVDKKARDGEVGFVLTPRIGEALWGQKVSKASLDHALNRI